MSTFEETIDNQPPSKGDILIIDDNPANLDLLSNMLAEQCYQVRVAINGRRALEGAKLVPPELILLDINMPEMDGYEVCRRLKADAGTHDIPVIFISALDEAIDKITAFQLGGIDYITKPFQLAEVLARIENQLRISRLQKDLTARNAELVLRNAELARKNAELLRSKEELVRSHEQTESIFSALAKVLPGTVLDDKYHLIEQLGTGGFGVVYRAIHIPLNKPVAVKIFRPLSGKITPEGLQRFRREGISSCRVNHPHAIAVLDSAISTTNIAYLVMELLNGHTLAAELKSQGSLSPTRAAEIILPVCQALAEAHLSGVVHRDIKPDNIFLHYSDGKEIVKVVDFGIAKLLSEASSTETINITLQDKVIGTPVYMSPERLSNRPYDGKTDIYSLGITSYRMLTGHFPYRFESAEFTAIAIMHIIKPPIPLREQSPSLPVALEEVVMRAIAKDPANRPTANEFAQLFISAIDSTNDFASIGDRSASELQNAEITELDNLPTTQNPES